jgi:hypothetical protein
MVNGSQLNLGNGTNVQNQYGNINVYYQNGLPLSFSNRMYNTVGTYTFNLHFNKGGNPNYDQITLYSRNIRFNSSNTPNHRYNEGTKNWNKQINE